MLAVPRQEELYSMNGCHGDMEGIDSSFGWYLKYVRNHLRQFFYFRIGVKNRNVFQIKPTFFSGFRVALATLIDDKLGYKNIKMWSMNIRSFASRQLVSRHA
ncbi:MAG: hypothetical protein ACOYKN_21920 [Pirellula sp.]